MTFEVIVVLDIGNATDLESSLSSAEWVEVSVEESIHKQLLSAEHLSGFVHDLETTKLKSKANRKKKVCIHELVSSNPILTQAAPDDTVTRHGLRLSGV